MWLMQTPQPWNLMAEAVHGVQTKVQHGGDNDGVASAKPTVITGSEDATVNKWPPGKKNPPKDWDVNYDPADHSGRE